MNAAKAETIMRILQVQKTYEVSNGQSAAKPLIVEGSETIIRPSRTDEGIVQL